MKRAAPAPAIELNELLLTPLGAGNEVGRSCMVMRFKGLVVMFDCGVLPSFSGEESLPYLREIDPAEIDVVVITCAPAGGRQTNCCARSPPPLPPCLFGQQALPPRPRGRAAALY